MNCRALRFEHSFAACISCHAKGDLGKDDMNCCSPRSDIVASLCSSCHTRRASSEDVLSCRVLRR